MSKKSTFTYSNPTDAANIGKIFDSLSSKSYATYGVQFGEGFSANAKLKDDIVETAAQLGFGGDIRKARGESSPATAEGVNASYRTSFVNGLYNEFLERGRNMVSARGENFQVHGDAAPSQMWGYMGANNVFSNNSQLLLMALFPAVIKPVHNKIVKSLVVKTREFYREALVPYIMDENGNMYDFYSALNSSDLLTTIADGGQPIMKVSVDFDNKVVDANLCDIYNAAEQLKNPKNFRAITSVSDFVARGVKINKVVVNDGAKNVEQAIDYRTTGNITQSGQLNTNIATIDLVLSKVEGSTGDNIHIFGRILADGKVVLHANSDKIKSLEFEFIVPSKGAQNPLTTVDRTTTLNIPINRKTAHKMSLNAQHLDDAQLYLNKDLVAQFNERVVEMTNAKKDQELLQYIIKQTDVMRQTQSKAETYANYETVINRYAEYADAIIDMNVFNAGYTNYLEAGAIALAKGMFDVTNAIDVKLNPEVKEFSVVSSSSAAQWVKNVDGEHGVSFQLTGQVTDESSTVAGITPLYTLNRISIGGQYGGTYITTNRLKSEKISVNTLDNTGAPRVVASNEHTYYLIPRFEENMDTILFLHGLERVTEGVFDPEFNRDRTLQYETRYDIATYNKSLAMVKFVESPTNINTSNVTK